MTRRYIDVCQEEVQKWSEVRGLVRDAVDPCVVAKWEADPFTSVNIWSQTHETIGGPLGPCKSQLWTLVR